MEGIVENLGPGGYYGGEAGIIPDGRWWRFIYCTLVNTLMLAVSLIGASLFAKTNVLILGVVIVCLLSTFISFLVQPSIEVNKLDRHIHPMTRGTYPSSANAFFAFLLRFHSPMKIPLFKMQRII